MPKGLEGINRLKTAPLVSSRAAMYSMILQALELHTIVTKSVMPIARACQKIHINSRFSSSFEPCHQEQDCFIFTKNSVLTLVVPRVPTRLTDDFSLFYGLGQPLQENETALPAQGWQMRV